VFIQHVILNNVGATELQDNAATAAALPVFPTLAPCFAMAGSYKFMQQPVKYGHLLHLYFSRDFLTYLTLRH
jgi:hypothetical protein